MRTFFRVWCPFLFILLCCLSLHQQHLHHTLTFSCLPFSLFLLLSQQINSNKMDRRVCAAVVAVVLVVLLCAGGAQAAAKQKKKADITHKVSVVVDRCEHPPLSLRCCNTRASQTVSSTATATNRLLLHTHSDHTPNKNNRCFLILRSMESPRVRDL